MFDHWTGAPELEHVITEFANGTRWEQSRQPPGMIQSSRGERQAVFETYYYAVVVKHEGNHFALELEIRTGVTPQTLELRNQPTDRAYSTARIHLPYDDDEEGAIEAAREGNRRWRECDLLKQPCYVRWLSSTADVRLAQFLFDDPGIECEVPFGDRSARRANNLLSRSLETQRTPQFWEKLELELWRMIKSPRWAPAPTYTQCGCCAGKGAVKL